MPSESRRRALWGIITAILFVVGLAGVEDDVNVWIGWIDIGLKLVNHDVARWACVILALFSLGLIFYRPNIRQEIAARFRIGQPIAIAYFTEPITSHGWTLKSGPEPVCSSVSVPGVGMATHCASTSQVAVLRYEFPDPDPSGRYVVVRADRFGLNRVGEWFNSWHTGFNFQFDFKVRRKSDGQVIKVTILPSFDFETVRSGGSHHWIVKATRYEDHAKYENLTVDLAELKSLEYDPSKYDFLGVSAFEITLGSASIVRMYVCQAATWRGQRRVAFMRETWLPWL